MPDLIVGNSTGELLYYENLGTAGAPALALETFVHAGDEPVRIAAGLTGSIQGPSEKMFGYSCPTIADWDGDGKPDILFGDILGYHRFLRNAGEGRLGRFAEGELLHYNGCPLKTVWRNRPAVVDWSGNGTLHYVTSDEEGVLCDYRRVSDTELADKRVLRWENGEGRQFEADITTGYETMGVSLHTRMGDQPYEEVLLTTATPVLEGRIIKIWRNMRQPNADLPDPAELTAQLEAFYGPPSWVGPDPIGARMVKYVWTPSGQLAPQQEEPCSRLTYRGYAFDNDREPIAPPECSAVFTMTYEAEAGQSTVRFSPIDFDLARQDLAETDRQILEQISDEGVRPSDMKL